MISPNTYPSPSPETINQACSSLYDAVALLEPDQAPLLTAVREIKGAKLATMFFEGYLNRLAIRIELETGGDPIKGLPSLEDVAFDHVKEAIAYGVSTETTVLLEPWQRAHEAIKAGRHYPQVVAEERPTEISSGAV